MTTGDGFTLLERVITLSVLSVLAGLALTLFESVATIQRSMQHDVAAMRDVRRLADALRSDAAITTAREVVDDRATLRKVGASTQVVYQIIDSQVRRETRETNEADDVGNILAREAFSLPSNSEAVFRRESEDASAPLVLDIRLLNRHPLSIRIEALLATSNVSEAN